MNNQLDMPKSIVMPEVDGTQALEVWKAYQELKGKIIEKSDIQVIQGKEFLKKSYWRKVATFFSLTIDVVSESHEQLGRTIVWHFTIKATAQNGRSSIGTGSCDAYEKATLRDGQYVDRYNKPALPNSLHNIRSTAETRATNRAISNLVGGGEVSADEIISHTDVDVSDVPEEWQAEALAADTKKAQSRMAHVEDVDPDEVSSGIEKARLAAAKVRGAK